MRRTTLLLAALLTSALALLGLAGPGSASPVQHVDRTQYARNPDGRLVPTATAATSNQSNVQPDSASPAVTPDAGPGAGCTYRTTSQYFCRAGAYQYITAAGATMSTPVRSPTVAAADYHSLGEMAVESSDGQQIIEIGWRVYRPQDQTPRLFIFHWVNGQPTCYNTGCGFVQASSTSITPGMALSPSSTPTQFAIQYSGGNWWYGYNGTWFGYLPGSLWNNTFTTDQLTQYFGEVSTTTTRPCTDMGNGTIGTNTAAVSFSSIGYYGLSATTSALTRFTPDDSTLYDSQVTSGSSVRYGGPGAC